MKINPSTRSGQAFKLVIAIAVSEMAGIIGSVFTAPSIPSWYAGLAKPAFNPPAWVFGPVWTTLYALMGISAFLIWREYEASTRGEVEDLFRRKKQITVALILFGVQLILNTLWSVIFFGLHSPGGALIEIAFLWCAILATIVSFYPISRAAAWLLVPYILWVSFAAYLNYAIWALR